MLRTDWLLVIGLIGLASLWGSQVDAAPAAAPSAPPSTPGAKVIEAEAGVASASKIYGDPRASGGKCAVLLLADAGVGSPLIDRRVAFPAGDYVVTAWVEVYPVHLLHNFNLAFKVGNESRNFGTILFDPAPGYQPVSIKVVHPGGPMLISLAASGQIGFDGVRHDNSEDEKAAARTAGAKVELSDKKKKADEDTLDLDEAPPLSKLTYQDNRVVCDKIEVLALRTPESMVTGVEVDKIHYLPNEKVKATATLAGLDAGGKYQFVAELFTESDAVRQVFSQDVTLDPRGNTPVNFEFALDGKTEFGHELRCSLKKDGKVVHDHCAIFGVSKNVYRIGITGAAGPQNKALMTAEEAAKIHQANKEAYANYFELFAWAPSDYSDMTPDTERWWSGQTLYPGSRTGFRNFFTEAKKRGIKSMSYGSIGGGGIAAYNDYRKRPDYFDTFGGVGLLATYFLERSWRGEYSMPPKQGSGESISWSFWNAIWTSGSDAALDMHVNETLGAADQIGFDGVRWDFWWQNRMAEFKKKVAAKRPDFIWGYNVAFANPGSPCFVPNQESGTEDFHELAKDHGLIMDESVREWSHTNFSPGTCKPYYDAICRESNYVKRVGGMSLFITFDVGSKLDSTFSVICGLSGGQRYTYMTSPGDFAFGSMPKFLTRFSSFIWDDTAMIADAGKVVGVTVGKGPKDVLPWWDQSTWLRKSPDGKGQQLLVNLVNPVGNLAFCNRVQPPPATLRDVEVTVPIPAGAKLTRAFEVSPDLIEGQRALAVKTDGANAKVVVPVIRAWTIVVFDLAPAAGQLAYPAYKLTTPVEDAAAFIKAQDEKKAKEAQAKNTANKIGLVDGDKKDAAPAPPKPEEPFYFQFDKTFNGDEPASKKLKRLADMNIRKNGVLDVHHVKGSFSWLNPVELALGLAVGGAYESSYCYRETFKDTSNGFMQDFPENWAHLLKQDVLVLDNSHPMDLAGRRRVMIADYVRNGGGLLFFSGYDSLSMAFHHNTAMEEVLPVKVTGKKLTKLDNNGMELLPAKKDFFPGVDWSAHPMVCGVETSALKEGTEILATVGGLPAIVASTYGKGRVITVLINPHGDFPKGATPYYEWKSYPKLIAACLAWLAPDAAKTYTPKPEPVVIDEKEVVPSNLAVEGAMLDSAEFTKRLKSAMKNMQDAESAKTMLEIAVSEVDKIDDQEFLGTLVTEAEQYVDASFTPLARKLIASPHTMFKRVGLQVLGLTGEKSLRGAAEDAIRDVDVKTQRTALVAIGRIADPQSVPAVKRYLAAASDRNPVERMLALAVLRRLGDRETLKESLAAYTESRYQEVAMHCRRLSLYHSLTSGTSFKNTPMMVKTLKQQYDSAMEKEKAATFDNRYFADSLTNIVESDVAILAEYFAKADTYRVASLAYVALPRIPAALVPKFRAEIAGSSLPEIRDLAKD